MGSTVAELAAIRKALPGLTFTEVMGKAYSANRLAVLAATADGLSVSGDSLDMPELGSRQFGSFALWHRANARALVERYIADDSVEKSGPLLVVDDGGALIDAVGQAVLDGKIQQAVLAVEQTTHGLFAVQRFMKLPAARQRGFACVSVARSEAKLRLESKLIARSVAATTDYWLKLFGRPLRNVGIIGFGAVGAQLARELSSRDIEVRIYDKNPNKLAVADTVDGFEVAWTLPELLRRSEIIVGASGGTSIDFESTQHLQDNAILVSASSGDLEFSGLARWSLRLQPVLPRAAGLAPYDLAHGLLEATPADPLDNRTIHVVNRGFPVNFDGSPDPIPASEIQLTRALILGAVLQAAGGVDGEPLSGKTGLFELDRSVDHYVVEQYNKINGG